MREPTPDPAHLPPREVAVQRSDPIYNAHAYLTKVPVAAILPFIEAFTAPGDLVLDPFAGSGMTGVAAAMCGRRARLSDISELGQHIGQNYVNLVDAAALRAAAADVVALSKARVGDVYAVRCETCRHPGELSKRTWSVVLACPHCTAPNTYYRALEQAEWAKAGMRCHACGEALTAKGAARVGEEPVLDTIDCACTYRLIDQAPTPALTAPSLDGLAWPDVPIEADRQMYQASALGKHNLHTIADFFSQRNLTVLAAVRTHIAATHDGDVRAKLLYAFTGILTRASKRYQWSRQRPLNAANQNYYIAPVYYEWNVYDLFLRKVEALIRSDDCVRRARAVWSGGPLFEPPLAIDYRVQSADALDLPDASVDYVFTDPPFGGNIFYSDMNLFHEAWLGRFTDRTMEAVVDRSGPPTARRTASRYERILTDALRECHRVLTPNGRVSVVFSHSSGGMWAVLQRAVQAAGFVMDEDGIALLDKGQRSVKGLASGGEDVVTIDLILTMRKRRFADPPWSPDDQHLDPVLDDVLARNSHATPSHVYLDVVRAYLRHHWDPTGVDFSAVSRGLAARGYQADAKSGRFVTIARP